MAPRWLVLAAILASAPVTAAAQPTVLVTGGTRIELGTRRGTGFIVLSGVLRDDLGEPLGGRPVHVRLSHPDTLEGVVNDTVETTPDGHFSVIARVTTGDYRLSALFDGDSTHDRAEVSREVNLNRADVRLGVTVPTGGRVDLDQPSHTIDIHASCVGDSHGGIPISLVDEVDTELAQGVTDADGHLALVVRSESLGRPGAGRLKARSTADAERAEAQTEVPIVRFRRSALTLDADASSVRAGQILVLRGSLSDSQGPLGNRAIGLFDEEDTHLATVLTNATGSYQAEVRLDGEPRTLSIVGRFASDAPGREGAESNVIAVDLGGSAPASWLWAALPIGVCVLLLLLIARRAPRRLTAVPPAPPPAPAGIAVSLRSSRRPDRREVSGRVVGRSRERPLGGALATLRLAAGGELAEKTDADGAFLFEDVAPGEHLLRVVAPGFAAEETRVSTPTEESGPLSRFASKASEIA